VAFDGFVVHDNAVDTVDTSGPLNPPPRHKKQAFRLFVKRSDASIATHGHRRYAGLVFNLVQTNLSIYEWLHQGSAYLIAIAMWPFVIARCAAHRLVWTGTLIFRKAVSIPQRRASKPTADTLYMHCSQRGRLSTSTFNHLSDGLHVAFHSQPPWLSVEPLV
jgi:hypothetical protein